MTCEICYKKAVVIRALILKEGEPYLTPACNTCFQKYKRDRDKLKEKVRNNVC